MKKIKALALALCLGIIMVGCNNTQKGATIGTAGGAVLGAIIGKIAGNAGVGAAIGGAVGAGTGAIIGNRMDKVKKQAEAVQNAQVQQVTDANGLQAVKVTFDSGILFPTSSSTLLRHRVRLYSLLMCSSRTLTQTWPFRVIPTTIPGRVLQPNRVCRRI